MAVAKAHLTNAKGFFSLTVRASTRAKLRLWYPSGGVGSPPLLVS